MSRELQPVPLGRCLVVWSLVAAAGSAVPLSFRAELGTAAALARDGLAGTPFDAVLVAGCATVLSGCAAWFLLVSTVTLAAATRGRAARVPGCPDGVRRALLAACGLALVATAAPATADQTGGLPPGPVDEHVLRGLPYPDRPAVARRPGPRPVATEVTVRAGDSLWAIARRSLPRPGPSTDAAVDERWRQIWRLNRDVVGADPDLIHPGTTLRLPDPKES
jgi:nucleoid-associated protein YgaU